MKSQIHPVLLCGGSGTRLWPLSRKSYPKQFTPLTGDKSLFQASALRLSGKEMAAPTIVTSSDFRFIVVEQLAGVEIAPARILIEPAPRNTAAAICAAAVALDAKEAGAIMMVAPSDHEIPNKDAFHACIHQGAELARDGKIVTFGVAPDRAETAYGWLELSAPLTEGTPQPVVRFVEKPNKEVAETLFESGRHLWNAGIFMFSTTRILKAFEDHAPETLSACRASFENAEMDLGFTRLSAESWDECPDVSIDYAIMEHEAEIWTVPYSGGWSDLGDWYAVWRETKPDEDGLVTVGATTAVGCSNTLLHAAQDGQQLVGIGLQNIIAVAMPDAVLVADLNQAQDVRIAVDMLKDTKVRQAEAFPKEFRPWGWFENLVRGPRFQVNRIMVKPGAALSMQRHLHRSEHWVIVEGTARITVNDEEAVLTENQSTYIPVNAKHRLENPGKLPLMLIEVQTGSYLDEDDVIRYEAPQVSTWAT